MNLKFQCVPLDWSGLFAMGPAGSVVKTACQARYAGLIPGSGKSPGKGRCNPLQYSCLENSTDIGAWQATVHGVAKELDMT